MKAYQVFKGDTDKHDHQTWELMVTYLSKDRALEYANKMVSETKLYGDTLVVGDWKNDSQYWYAHGWSYIGICRVDEIEITE